MQALAVARGTGLDITVIQYLKKAERPDRAALDALIDVLEDPVEDLVRKDSRFRELGLDPADYVGNGKAVLDLLAQHIDLLQRPILVRRGRAIIGRPKERVPAFLA